MPYSLPWPLCLILLIVAVTISAIVLYAEKMRGRTQLLNLEMELQQLRSKKRLLLEQSEREKTIFLNAVGIAFLLMRPSGRIVASNQAADELFLLRKTSQPLNLLEHMEGNPARQTLAQIAHCKQAQSYKVHVYKEGLNYIYRVQATPMDNLYGEPLIGLVCHDITEEQRTLTIRRDFVANASHELRTPLTIIRGYLETLIDDPEQAEDPYMRQRALGLMKKHSDRIVRLVEDMLTISRLERSDKAHLRMKEFNLQSVVEDVALRLDSSTRLLNDRIDIEIAPLPFTMVGDQFYWEQILFNLMENAVKNNPQGSLRILVRAQLREQGDAEIIIEDNGCGIKAESLPYIFNRFFRADSTGQIKGTGLGLSIVRNAIEAHGGHIHAESEPEVYTRFTIHTPLHAPVVG